MKIKKKLLKFDHSLVIVPKKGAKLNEKLKTIYWNIWNQFGLTKETKNITKYKINDFYWSAEAKAEFYAVPFHAKMLKSFDKRKLTSSWRLDCEPVDIEPHNNMAKKIFNPSSKWIYGSFTKNKQLRGTQQNKYVANMGSELAIKIGVKKMHGSRIEQASLTYIRRIVYRDFWITIEFMKGTPLSTKRWVKAWTIKNGFVFKDKPYQWSQSITSATQHISIGPWSKKPWSINKPGTHTERADWV